MTRHANEKWTPSGRGFDAEKAAEDFTRASIVDGVVRWQANEQVPFEDMLFDFVTIGAIDEATAARSNAAREAETRAFCAEYRRQMANHVPDAEEMFEMRAAFGEGAEVVNIITGKRTRL